VCVLTGAAPFPGKPMTDFQKIVRETYTSVFQKLAWNQKLSIIENVTFFCF